MTIKRITLRVFLFLLVLISLLLKPMNKSTRSKRKIELPPIVLTPDQLLETYLDRSVKHKGERGLRKEREIVLKVIDTACLPHPSKETLSFIEKTAQACGFKKNLFVSHEEEESSAIRYIDFDVFQLSLSKEESGEILASTILHELGHATLGHCIGDKKKTDRNTRVDNHQEEYAADNYAIHHLLGLKDYKTLAWEIIENINDPHLKRETFTHPAAIDRAQNILTHFNDHLKPQAISVEDLTSGKSRLLDKQTKKALKCALEKLKKQS